MKYFITFVLAIFLASCGIKNKKQTTTTETEKTTAEARKNDSIKKIETIISQRVEERVAEYRAETTNKEAENTTDTETVEVIEYSGGDPLVIETDKQVFKIAGDGKITRTTKTINKKLNREQIAKINEQISSSDKSKIDSINITSFVKTEVKKVISETQKEKTEKDKNVKRSGPGFWFWFWVILIFIIILAIYLGRKWLLVQFPFIKILKF